MTLAMWVRAACAALVLVTMLPGTAHAQRFDLTISPTTVTFPLSDPDTVPILSSVPVQVTYRVRQYVGPWTLTLLAMGDLISGLSVVDISNVSWVATPAPPFQNGILSRTVAQRLASGIAPINPAATGQITFRLANSWTYTAGLYTQTLVFTLSTP